MQHSLPWQDILKTALLGTERQPLVLPPSGNSDKLSSLLAAVNATDHETALLSATAICALYQRAGQLPVTGDSTAPEPCPPDETPRCSRAAGARLALVLQGQIAVVLPEWLAAATAAGLRAPEELLPDLLEFGRRHANLRSAIAPVLGRRGRWLAAQNPAWSYVAGEAAATDEETWETGNKAARLEVLRHLRQQDAARAREILQTTWEQEPPKDRSDFLETFAVNLSMEDEPFLESALDDRRKETRSVAVDLLARLPDSRLVQRMIERVQPLVKFSQVGALKGLLKGKARIEVTLPSAFDKTMARDGLEEKIPAGVTLGEKAWWLQQMIALVPPDFWCREWQKTPEEIIITAKTSEWKKALLEGFKQAALRHRAEAWIDVLFEEAIQEQRFSEPELLKQLPVERIEAYAMGLLKDNKGRLIGDKSHNIGLLIGASHHAWSESFSRAVLAAMRLECAEAASWQQLQIFRPAFQHAALHMPAHLADEAATGWPIESDNWEPWRPVVDDALALLQFRHDMLRELSTSEK